MRTTLGSVGQTVANAIARRGTDNYVQSMLSRRRHHCRRRRRRRGCAVVVVVRHLRHYDVWSTFAPRPVAARSGAFC